MGLFSYFDYLQIFIITLVVVVVGRVAILVAFL